jgi:hypothetical protein
MYRILYGTYAESLERSLRSLAEARHLLGTSAPSSPPLLCSLTASLDKGMTQKNETDLANLDLGPL